MDDYEAEEDDEISFPKGTIVDVLQKRLDGWWFVKLDEKTGLAPATFLRKGLPPAKPELVREIDLCYCIYKSVVLLFTHVHS